MILWRLSAFVLFFLIAKNLSAFLIVSFEYSSKLPLDEQERYLHENLDLRYYKDDMTVGLTNDKYLNAKHAEEISRRTGKPFTDRYKVY